MEQAVRWGILGVADIALEQTAPAIHAASGGRLAAVATSSEAAKADPLARMAPGLRVFTDYDALLADPDIDAVYVPLPNHMHVDWSSRAARAGKAVLCEKPVAPDLAGLDALIAVRDETGRLIAEAWMIRHHPQWGKLRALFDDGAIGRPTRLAASFSAPLFEESDFRNRPPGGGALRDLGVYVLGSAMLATGETEAEILHAEIDWENGIDATVQVAARFPSFRFDGHLSMRSALWQSFELHGDEGTLRLAVPFNPLGLGTAVVELCRGDTRQAWRFPEVNQYVRQFEAFNAALTDGSPFPHPLESSRELQVMVDAVYAAAGAAPP
jgi:predicted dehydrogenase